MNYATELDCSRFSVTEKSYPIITESYVVFFCRQNCTFLRNNKKNYAKRIIDFFIIYYLIIVISQAHTSS